MTIYSFPMTKERAMRATAHFKLGWRCEWCGRRLKSSAGWQIAAHKSACNRRPKRDK